MLDIEPDHEITPRPMISRSGMRLMCALLAVLAFLLISLLTIGRGFGLPQYLMELFR